jgi:NAD(P)H dehydrogenase (quinone)
MILVTGATGQFGSTVINSLLRKGIPKNKISALARNIEKVDELKAKGINLIYGDYDDYASLAKAFKGVDKLLFVPGRDLGKRIVQNENVVKAAIENGIKQFVYASFERKNETETSPLWMIAEADFIGKDIRQTGTIYLPAGNGKVSAALRSDMAGAAAEVLVSAGHENKIYDITNTEAYSYNDIAKYLSEIFAKPINYVSPQPEEFAETLTKLGVPARVVQITVGFALAQAQGDLDIVSNDLENLLGRKPVSLKDYLKYFYKKTD